MPSRGGWGGTSGRTPRLRTWCGGNTTLWRSPSGRRAAWTSTESAPAPCSIFEHEGTYHAFYATRLKRPDGTVFEAVCRAAGRDLIHFDKSPDNPLFGAPPDLDPANHRDPFVFRHPKTGEFHMLVTASHAGRGVLAHYTSPDLAQWGYQGPFLPLDGPSPECPEHFFWNGWWYLIYSQDAQMQYWISADPLGPWRRAGRETIEGPNLSVPRTAAFRGGRRLAAGFLPWRRDDRDGGGWAYAGNAVFRGIRQDTDGTLTTRFVPEMMPMAGSPVPGRWQNNSDGAIALEAGQEVCTVQIGITPTDCVLTCRFIPDAGATEYGLLLRADERLETGYRLCFLPDEERVVLQSWPHEGSRPNAAALGVENLGQSVEVVICMKNSLIDACLNDRHTLIERAFDYRGTSLGLFVRAGQVRVEDLCLAPIRGEANLC